MNISKQLKLKEHRGEGHGAQYKPWVKVREVNLLKTGSNAIDWKTGRATELLSQTEYGLFMMLRWDDAVQEIREQFPLGDMEVENVVNEENRKRELLKQSPLPMPNLDDDCMYTTFLVDFIDGSCKAIAVVSDSSHLSDIQINRCWIQKQYWRRKGVPFEIKDYHSINKTLVRNIRLVTEFYEENRVFDLASSIKHAIATGAIKVDMQHQILDFSNPSIYLQQIPETVRKGLLNGTEH